MSTPSVAVFFRRLFPHRQFYIRSRGTVQFYELSPAVQMAFASIALMFLGWVAYSSVVVIFKEQIISAKNQRYASMQAAYEGRVSQMQLQYDEMNSLLTLAEERFQNATRDLENKHRQLTSLLMQKQAMERDMKEVKRKVAIMDGFAGRTNFARVLGGPDGSNELAMLETPADSVARISKGLEPNSESTIANVAASVMPRKGRGGNLSQNFVVKKIGALEDRLMVVKKSQMALLREMQDSAQVGIDRMEAMLSTTGLNINEMVATLGANMRTGRGGPLLPIGALRGAAVDPAADEFERQISRVAVSFNRLDALTTTLTRIPLVTPVPNGQYRLTSGFGYRVDPFTGRGAFHAGTDLASEYGTPVLVTATGTVVTAERKGPYGNMIEIDHGYGIRTRYGHLQQILVSVGDKVRFRQKIALMGSTGRSTGPHLHYEIWFKNVVRDPMKFFHAGRYVFEG
jgi:murein DD-endopeptidase MepM/ murein hydrolase activator NlpD